MAAVSVAGTKAVNSAKNGGTIARTAVLNVAYFLCGILISRGAVLGELAPFGASYSAAVPKKFLFSALAGTALGYIILKPSDSFRYLAVIIAIGALRWLLSDITIVSESRIFAPLVAFVPLTATGTILLFSSSSTMTSFADCLIEAVIAGAAAYFINIAVALAGQKRGISAFNQQETASLVMTGCVMVLAFGSITYQNISLGRIIAVIIIMLCAAYGGIAGGAVSGIATGSIFSIADRGQGFICGGFAFGGLMAGLFSSLGKIGCAISFVIANGVMSLAFNQNVTMPNFLLESLAGAGVFLFLPAEVGNIISPMFISDKKSTLSEVLHKNLIMRLNFASKAVYNVKNDVNKVSEELKKLYSPTFDSVCENVAEDVCNGCGLRKYCFEHKGGVTYDDFHRLEEILQIKGEISDKDVDKAFIKKCCKKGEIADSMNANYREYLSGIEAEQRVADIRSVVAGQFAGVSDILSDLADEFSTALRCDAEASKRIIKAMQELGAMPTECICMLSDNGRMIVELELSEKSERKVSKGMIMREVSKCCGRRFDLPTVSYAGGRARVALCEMPTYDVEIGTDQHIANGSKLCGDCIDYFNDGFGKTYAIVCDGMGTGGRAAVDGNMAVSVMGRLLRSGLSADSSLQIVNSALMIKSEDESLSTLDVTSIDLYTGKVTLRKAGAPLTLIKRNGRIISSEMPSLPAGILSSIKFSSDTYRLSTGDMIVMVSDGVVTGDEKWLEKLIKSWNEGSTQDLARAVVDEAIKRRNDSREDDMTAVAIKLIEN